MEEACEDMVALFGANVSEYMGEVSINTSEDGHATRALIRGKGFTNDWHKVYFN